MALIVLALVAALVPLPAGWVESLYWQRFYLSVQPYVTSVSNLVPFALLDVAVAIVLATFIFFVVRDWRTRGARRAAGAAVMRLLTITAAVYLLFLISWGLNYRRVPLEDRLDFSRTRITQDAARQLAVAAIEHVNAGYDRAHTAAFDVHALERSYIETQSLLGTPRPAITGRAKRSLAGIYFRFAAIDGMTVPVFLEVILNPDVLPVERPSVLAHEWAHLAGYADESEANFIAWIAGIRSSDPVAQYSAWLDAYTHATSALPRNVRATLPKLDEGPRRDLREIGARYERSSPLVRKAAREAYDSYLKANRIQEGIDNYGAVLQLMLGTRFDQDWRPRLSTSNGPTANSQLPTSNFQLPTPNFQLPR